VRNGQRTAPSSNARRRVVLACLLASFIAGCVRSEAERVTVSFWAMGREADAVAHLLRSSGSAVIRL